MKIIEIQTVTTHRVYTEDNCYTRYSDGSWTEEKCYDIISEEQPVESKLEKELEELFQIEQGYKPMDDDEFLYDADPNCNHVHDPNCYSGIRCHKCGGWYCL